MMTKTHFKNEDTDDTREEVKERGLPLVSDQSCSWAAAFDLTQPMSTTRCFPASKYQQNERKQYK